MRATIAVLAVAAALPLAAPVRGENARTIVVTKISLINQDPNQILRLLVGSPEAEQPSFGFTGNGGLPQASAGAARPGAPIPKDVSGILGYPLDKSLLVRG